MSKERMAEHMYREPVGCATCRAVINGPVVRRGKLYYHRPECVPDGSWAGWNVRPNARIGGSDVA